ncbi:MAG: hypothetical protein KGI54_14245 [Pseudomonadota bacterium]|nr:hypothetical protein [Pseudomonadota bacterium]
MPENIDENVNANLEGNPEPTETSSEERQYTKVELEAMDQGWVPEEEYTGDPDRYVSAKEFIQRGELFKKIESQSRELREQRKMLEHLSQLSKQSYDAGVKQTLANLRNARKEAFAEGDLDKVSQIEERIDAVKEQVEAQKASENIPQVPQVAPELQTWIDKNRWYETDVVMRGAADAIGIQLAREGRSPTDVLREVERRIKQEFPNKFHNPNRDRAASVEGGNGVRKVSKNSDDVELTPLERDMMNKLVRAGHLTEKEYKDQIKQINGVS